MQKWKIAQDFAHSLCTIWTRPSFTFMLFSTQTALQTGLLFTHTHTRLVLHTNTHRSIETYGCGNKMHNFLFISRTCEGPSELRGHIDFSSFHAVTRGLPIFSFIFKDNSWESSFPFSSRFFSFFPPLPLPLLAIVHTHTPTCAAGRTHPFSTTTSPSLTLKIVIQP